MAPRQPSQVSIGKKPMAYPPATNNPNATPATNGQGGGKSARAAAKAPASFDEVPEALDAEDDDLPF